MHKVLGIRPPKPARWMRCKSTMQHLSSSTKTAALQVGNILTLKCTELTDGGGVCKLEDAHSTPNGGGMVIFVPRALPGEVLTARVSTVKRSFARGEKLATLQLHDNPCAAVCRHFGPCGGCSLQELQYQAQLEAKQIQMEQLLRRMAGLSEDAVVDILQPIVPSALQLSYRNKMEFSFSPAIGHLEKKSPATSARKNNSNNNKSGSASGFALGLHLPGSYEKVLPIEDCSLQSPTANEILRTVYRLCRDFILCPCASAPIISKHKTRNSREGFMEHVVIRKSWGNSDNNNDISAATDTSVLPSLNEKYLVNFVTSKDAQEELAPIAAALAEEYGSQLAGVVNSVSQPGRPQAERRIAKEHILYGQGSLIEHICGLKFEISPNSFFQPNTLQMQKLYKIAVDAAQLKPNDTVLDLYCGSGTMTLLLAKHCKRAIGADISSSSVHDAQRNAELNGIKNAKFLHGAIEKMLDKLPENIDVVVTDPARGGMASDVVQFLRRSKARRLVYVSCNPATLARDIKLLCAGDGAGKQFKILSVQPVDMLPMTMHVEAVAVLER